MPSQPTKKELLKQLEQISQKSDALFADFQKRLNDLESRKKRLLEAMRKRVDDEAIKKILMSIK